MQQPDYYYQFSHQNPNPNSTPTTTTFHPPPSASAPPYTTTYAAAAPPPPPPSSDYSSAPPYTTTYPAAAAPTASSYAQFDSHHAPYQPQPPPQSYYHQTTSNYAPAPVANPSPNLNNPGSNYQYNMYENSKPYESSAPKFDQTGGGNGGYSYTDDYSGRYGGYNRSSSDSGHVYGGGLKNDSGGFGGGDGASRYDLGGYGGNDGASRSNLGTFGGGNGVSRNDSGVYSGGNGESRYDSGGYGGNDGPSRYESGGYGGNDGASRYDSGGYGGDGVYAYQGSKVKPYGSQGNGSKSSMWKDNSQKLMFDDFGRPIGLGNGKEQSSGSPKIVKAVPKADSQQDSKGGGVQKFRVKLLGESGGQSTQDVLCQIGLDGIRMLDPSTSRTLRIYPLDTITRCEVIDSSTFTFWSKSSVDYDAKRIRLQSNSYTTNTLLDTVTAATIQLKEMGGRSRPADHAKVTEEPSEKKKGLGDWMNAIKPVNEEKDHWVPDEAVNKCTSCGTDFGAFVRRHHCRNCGDIFCVKCTQGRIALTAEENAPQVRVCDRCMAEVTTRLSNAKETASRSAGLQTHEDLAKKLQEELERNRKSSSGSKSNGSGKRMKEVACPTCTVHLQVQVPSSGSETIECGVCQHPFLVSAH